MTPITVTHVLNNGYVKLVNHMGGDQAVIENARRCYRSEPKGNAADRKLIRHLITAGHKTPFEADVYHFDVKAPLFVARQWFRHRMAGYNEESLRYCIAQKDFYIPDELVEGTEAWAYWIDHHRNAFELYDYLLAGGMKKEQARAILPVSIYTSWYWTINGSSLQNFLQLRNDEHAQPEIQEYARAILTMVQAVAPICWEEFSKARGPANEGRSN